MAANPFWTPHEVRLVEMVMQGLENKEIATRLCVTHESVRLFLFRAYRKVGVHKRIQLVNWVVATDWGRIFLAGKQGSD